MLTTGVNNPGICEQLPDPHYYNLNYRMLASIEPPGKSLEEINIEVSRAQRQRDVKGLHNLLISKGKYFVNSQQLDEALITINSAYVNSLGQSLEHQILEASTLLSKIHLAKDLRIESLDYLHKGLSLSEQLRDSAMISWYLPVTVQVELETGNIGRAMEYALKSKAYFEQNHDTLSLIYSLLQLSAIHNQLGNITTSQRCIDITKSLLASQKCKSSDYANAHIIVAQAELFILEDKLEEAKLCCDSALEILRPLDEIKALRLEAKIAEILSKKKHYAQAESLLKRTLAQQQTIGDYTGQAYGYLCLANLQKSNSQFAKASTNYKHSLSIASNAGLTDIVRQAYKGMSQVNNMVGNIVSAYTNISHYTRITDSLFNAQKISEANKLEEQATHRKHLEEIHFKNIELERSKELIGQQKRWQILLVITIGLFIAIIALAVREYLHKRRANDLLIAQKNEVEKQKKLSDRKTRHFTESLNYAQRMQKAILMSSHSLPNLFPESFTILIPKDIVSGDFYWIQEKGDSVLFALADCTGHGVPGALMSVIGAYSLNKVVNDQSINSPGDVLYHVNTLFEQHLKQRDPNEIFDGMDIALCCFNPKTKELKYSGANLPLYICRANEQPQPTSTTIAKGKTHSLYSVRPTKQPIGSFYENKAFVNHSISLLEGDIIYLFTDGFADQFGGPERRKFKSLQLYRLILSLTELPLAEQKTTLEETFNQWKGNLTQVDDVGFLGVKI
jgi:serine phosphatase RsbU (regulator of sigma subunit)